MATHIDNHQKIVLTHLHIFRLFSDAEMRGIALRIAFSSITLAAIKKLFCLCHLCLRIIDTIFKSREFFATRTEQFFNGHLSQPNLFTAQCSCKTVCRVYGRNHQDLRGRVCSIFKGRGKFLIIFWSQSGAKSSRSQGQNHLIGQFSYFFWLFSSFSRSL